MAGLSGNRPNHLISHLSLGVAKLQSAITFYDRALAPLGLVRLWSDEKVAGYGPPAEWTAWP